MTEPATERRRKKTGKGALLGFVYGGCFVFAVVVSAVVIYTGNETLMRVGLVLALWAALGWAFIADNSRRKAELVSAKASDYKLIYDLQLEREIAARHHYELSLEKELRRQLAAEADATTHNVLAELQQQVAVLRGQLQELLDQDLEYDQPALKARATRLDELLVARQSLGAHESQPRKRAAETAGMPPEPQWGAGGGAAAPANPPAGAERGPSKLWLPSQADQGRREPPQQPQQRGNAEPPAQALVSDPAPEQWQPEEQPAAWRHPEPVVPEPERTFDYPSWYAQPADEQVTGQAEPLEEPASWHDQPVGPEPQPVEQASEPVVEAAAPEPVEPVVEAAAPEPVQSEPRQEATHGKPEKSKHAGKGGNPAKPSESRGGRRAKPVAGGGPAAPEERQDEPASADAAGAHAAGHSVGELLSRLTPDEAAGYHGRRRRSQISDDEAR